LGYNISEIIYPEGVSEMLNNTQRDTMRDTRKFPSASDRDATIREILFAVYTALEEKGYNPVSQIVGYIISEDPTYITSHRNARGLISKLDRDEILDALSRYYFSDIAQK
jgi:uncharacterized protein (UPF0297 family)